MEASLCCTVKTYIEFNVVQVYYTCRQTSMAEDDAGPQNRDACKDVAYLEKDTTLKQHAKDTTLKQHAHWIWRDRQSCHS